MAKNCAKIAGKLRWHTQPSSTQPLQSHINPTRGIGPRGVAFEANFVGSKCAMGDFFYLS